MGSFHVYPLHGRLHHGTATFPRRRVEGRIQPSAEQCIRGSLRRRHEHPHPRHTLEADVSPLAFSRRISKYESYTPLLELSDQPPFHSHPPRFRASPL